MDHQNTGIKIAFIKNSNHKIVIKITTNTILVSTNMSSYYLMFLILLIDNTKLIKYLYL